LNPSNGTAPTLLTVTMDPQHLRLGALRDTVLFRTTGSSGRPVMLPVEFTVQPCTVTAIDFLDEVIDTLDESDCSTPHRPDHLGRVFRFGAAAGDSVTVVMRSSSVDGFLILSTALDENAPPLTASDDCGTRSGDPCLSYVLLSETATYYIEATTSNAEGTGSFRLLLTTPRHPLAPTALGQFGSDGVTPVPMAGAVGESGIVLSASLADPDSFDIVSLEVEVRSNEVPFTGEPTATSPPVENGGTVLVAVVDLTDNTAYHWQARTVDQTGRQSPWTTFGENPESHADFRVTVADAPAAPADAGQFRSPGGDEIPVGSTIEELFVEFRATVSDPDGDSLRLELELRPVGQAFIGTPTGSSVKVASGTLTSVSSGLLQDGIGYHWQARTVDERGFTSQWIAFGGNNESDPDFTIALPGTLLPPTGLTQLRRDGTTVISVGEAIAEPAVVIQAVVNHTNPTATVQLELEVRPVGVSFTTPTVQSDPFAPGTAVKLTVTGLSDDTGYHWRVRTADEGGAAVTPWVHFGHNADPDEPDFLVTVPATELAFTVQPSSSAVGTVMEPAIQLAALEASGTVDTSFVGAVALGITSGTGTAGAALTGTTSVTAASGIATFSDLSLDSVGTGYTLYAVAGDLPPVTSQPFDITPGQLQFTIQPTDTRAGLEITPVVEVTAFDTNGNTATSFTGTVTVTLDPNPWGGMLGGTLTTTAVNGVATFADLTIDLVGSAYTLTASAADLASATSGPFAISPASATQLAFTGQPSSTVQNETLTPAVAITAFDAYGNVDTNFSSTVTLTITAGTGTPGAILNGTTAVAAANGVATFSDLTTDSVGVGFTLDATASDLISAVSEPFDILPAPAVELRFSGQPTTAQAGASITPAVAVTAFDGSGNVATAFTGTVTITLGANPRGGTLGGTLNTAAVAGVATFADLFIDLVGTGYTLVASAPNLTSATSDPFENTPAPATQLTFTGQPSSTVQNGTMAPAVAVTAFDAYGNIDTNFSGTVTLTITAGTGTAGATLNGTTVMAAANGVATFSDLGITAVGTGYTLDATVGGLTGAISEAFDITPGELLFTVQPSRTQAGIAMTPALEVTAFDADGNVVTSFAGIVTVALGQNPGGGTLSGTLEVAAVAGVATFADLAIDRTGDGYTLMASSTHLNGTASNPFAITPAPATLLVFTRQPIDAVQDESMSPAPQVAALDAFGNVDTNFTGTVTTSITTGTGTAGAGLTGTTSVVAAAGVVSFGSLSVDSVGTGYTLDASAAGLSSATSEPFAITPAPAAELRFTVQPSHSQANAAITPAVEVTAFTASGKVATAFAGNVSIALGRNPGGGTLGGTLDVAAVRGVATFVDLAIERVGTGYTLAASSEALPGATSVPFNVFAAPPAELRFTGQPTVAQAGAAITPAVAVTAFDPFGNVATGFSGTVSVALGANPAGGTLSGTLDASAVAGVATFANLAVERVGTGYTLVAASRLPSPRRRRRRSSSPWSRLMRLPAVRSRRPWRSRRSMRLATSTPTSGAR
jgi:hypothetical protein